MFTTKSLLPFFVSIDVSCSGYSQPSHYCLFCQHGCIVLEVFTAKSLLPFFVSMDLACSGFSQPSLYCLSVSAWMYRAMGIHN
ncbi:hypothetical protein DPMN_021839 [Dreissena polymorpha]|uniref:Uncharacterized protein n=1 Tax=Dreissena polymorpha TaxID=45954 RepID=A0A9D4SAB1_DREPO|nr:hypothetical protein DPMN_021839 [Dreissena polymorpha]